MFVDEWGFPRSVFFFRGAVCLFIRLPSLGWCTHWSAFGLANWVAFGVVGGRGPSSGPMGQVGYVHAWACGLSCRVRPWFSGLGGCASRIREVMG